MGETFKTLTLANRWIEENPDYLKNKVDGGSEEEGKVQGKENKEKKTDECYSDSQSDSSSDEDQETSQKDTAQKGIVKEKSKEEKEEAGGSSTKPDVAKSPPSALKPGDQRNKAIMANPGICAMKEVSSAAGKSLKSKDKPKEKPEKKPNDNSSSSEDSSD